MASTADAASLEQPEGDFGEVESLTTKRGARNSAADLARIQAAHDELVALGARCHAEDDADAQDDDADDQGDDETWDQDPDADDEADDDGALDDAADKAWPSPERVRWPDREAAQDAALRSQLRQLSRTVAKLQKRLAEVAAEPQPPKTAAGWARAVTKAEDASVGPAAINPEDLRKYLDSLSPQERGRLELRAALSRPISAVG